MVYIWNNPPSICLHVPFFYITCVFCTSGGR
jgi:hypothetical protein